MQRGGRRSSAGEVGFPVAADPGSSMAGGGRVENPLLKPLLSSLRDSAGGPLLWDTPQKINPGKAKGMCQMWQYTSAAGKP